MVMVPRCCRQQTKSPPIHWEMCGPRPLHAEGVEDLGLTLLLRAVDAAARLTLLDCSMMTALAKPSLCHPKLIAELPSCRLLSTGFVVIVPSWKLDLC